jgi:sulfotransferase family protein
MGSTFRQLRRRYLPAALRGKPLRRLEREFAQRRYRHPHRNLLVIGQQKSGSTWLEKMLCDLPGFVRWVPGNIKFGQADLRRSDFDPPPPGYTVTKVHTPPSETNLGVVHALSRPYVVLTRDLRDIAVSWSFYVLNTPDHHRHKDIRGLPVERVIDYFIEHRLPEYAWWQSEWTRRLDPKLGLMIRYEDLLDDAAGHFARVVEHFGVRAGPERIGDIVERHAFARVTGRKRGQEDQTSFNRKGVAGDWRNHLSPEQASAFDAAMNRAQCPT